MNQFELDEVVTACCKAKMWQGKNVARQKFIKMNLIYVVTIVKSQKRNKFKFKTSLIDQFHNFQILVLLLK